MNDVYKFKTWKERLDPQSTQQPTHSNQSFANITMDTTSFTPILNPALTEIALHLNQQIKDASALINHRDNTTAKYNEFLKNIIKTNQSVLLALTPMLPR